MAAFSERQLVAAQRGRIVNQGIVIMLEGRPLELDQLSREATATLLIELSAVQQEIVARLCSPPTSARAIKGSVAISAGDQITGSAMNGHSSASTPGATGAMNDDPKGPAELGPEEKWLAVKETAARLGISHWTIYHWIEAGKLDEERGLRKFGRRRLIDWRVLKACLERAELK
jgi:excisionase family DNA binding protein